MGGTKRKTKKNRNVGMNIPQHAINQKSFEKNKIFMYSNNEIVVCFCFFHFFLKNLIFPNCERLGKNCKVW